MFRIHPEGFRFVLISGLSSLVFLLVYATFPGLIVFICFLLCFVFLLFNLQFFRYPKRIPPNTGKNEMIAPADGKVVAIEEIDANRIQISIFMSPLNVHINWMPISGTVTRSEYFAGKYLVAWHPKSSTENERHEVDILCDSGHQICVKQIAGAVARRIVNFTKETQKLEQGEELGFIKFGSRVDILLPKEAEILVTKDQIVRGNTNLIARL
jgi:phosphatidylserine decarboxylase